MDSPSFDISDALSTSLIMFRMLLLGHCAYCSSDNVCQLQVSAPVPDHCDGTPEHGMIVTRNSDVSGLGRQGLDTRYPRPGPIPGSRLGLVWIRPQARPNTSLTSSRIHFAFGFVVVPRAIVSFLREQTDLPTSAAARLFARLPSGKCI